MSPRQREPPRRRTVPRGRGGSRHVALSLFWRTFFLLALLLAGGIAAWVATFRALDFEPRAVQAAQQIASLVNLSRAALRYAERLNRVALVRTMSDQESVRVLLREPRDQWEPFGTDRFERAIVDALQERLGPDTIVASSVNGKPGLWVGFTIERDPYWLQADPTRVQMLRSGTWVVWIGIALAATLLGSAAVARLINQPLRDLSHVANRISDGEYGSRLDETTLTSEVRQVNMGFNRMARELARVEEDRTVMLAGISHDLRTPLARIRLEAEMSVADEDARQNIAQDIAQLDAIIDKFMDYARPGEVRLAAVPLAALVDREAAAFRNPAEIRIESRVGPDVRVMADDTELARVLQNLFENARRYGRPTPGGTARVEVGCEEEGPWVATTVRDHGPGVDPAKLSQLATPFFRGDTARTSATGAGLGLAIVDKAVQRMGGTFEVANAEGGGLAVRIRLKRAG